MHYIANIYPCASAVTYFVQSIQISTLELFQISHRIPSPPLSLFRLISRQITSYELFMEHLMLFLRHNESS